MQAPKSALSSSDSGERSYRLGAYGGSSLANAGGAAVPLAEQDAEKRRLEVRLGHMVSSVASGSSACTLSRSSCFSASKSPGPDGGP